jgi:hypothetical protein
MNIQNSVRARVNQILRTVLKIRAAEIVQRQILRHQIRSHRAVENDDFFF